MNDCHYDSTLGNATNACAQGTCRTTIRPTLIQIILADSIIVKFEVGVGGGWRRGGTPVFSCKL